MAVSRFPKTQQAIDDFIIKLLYTEEKPMAIEFNKVDARIVKKLIQPCGI
jgi:hypothetical protein